MEKIKPTNYDNHNIAEDKKRKTQMRWYTCSKMSKWMTSLTLKDQMILSIPQTKNATMRKKFRLIISTENFADKKELT